MLGTDIQFSIPYNGSIPFLFLNEVLKRAPYIDHVYCEFPLNKAISHFKPFINQPANEEIQTIYMDRCKEFLKISCGKVKRICTINASFYMFISEEECKIFSKLFETIFDACQDIEKKINKFK